MVLREDLYFEPRVINDTGSIRWYGEQYTAPEMRNHFEKTVYIRDTGEELYIYELENDKFWEAEKIEAMFTLICRIKKNNCGYRYGRKIT